MRPVLVVGGVLGVLVCIWTVRGQTNSNFSATSTSGQQVTSGATNTERVIRTIVVGEVEARSGPSLKFYPTSKLRQGDRIEVVREVKNGEMNWLAIKPPPGSFSWINKRFIKRQGRYTGVVVTDPEVAVPIRPGSSVTDKSPDVESVKVQRGTLVVILDDTPVYTETGAWLPIDVTPEEVRYIPADAVEGSPSLRPTATPTDGPNSPKAFAARAEQARRAGNLEQARQLYTEAARIATDYNERVHYIQQLDQITLTNGGQRAQLQPGHSQNSPNGSTNLNYHLTGQTVARMPTNNVSTTTYNTSSASATSPRWSGWGVLRKTQIPHNGQYLYVLEHQGRPIMYAVTRPDLTLEPYLGRMICLWGTVNYRSDEYLRSNYMTVSYVAMP